MNSSAQMNKRGSGRPSGKTVRNDALPQVPAFDQQMVYQQNGVANSTGSRRDGNANSHQAQAQPPSQMILFTSEDQRREFYQNQNLEVPQFSTLSADVIPQQSLLDKLDEHQPKIDPCVIEQLWRSAGVQTPDERVIKAASVMVEMQLSKIVQELKIVAAHSQHKQKHGGSSAAIQSGQPGNIGQGASGAAGGMGSHHAKTIMTYDDLQKSMDEFGVALRKPAFLSESARLPSVKRSSLQGTTNSVPRAAPSNQSTSALAHLLPMNAGQNINDISRQQK